MYGHAIATMALVEAYGMTGDETLKESAQKAFDYLVDAQDPGKGWRYTPRCGQSDSSVTGWCVMALKSAEWSGFRVPPSCFAGAKTWFDEVTTSDHNVGYSSKVTGPPIPLEMRSYRSVDHGTPVAIAAICRILIDNKRDAPQIKGGVERLIGDLPKWDRDNIDFYYWHFGSLAIFLHDGPSGPNWKKWLEALLDAICNNQKSAKDGCQNGSWDALEEKWGFEGGRVYATAINVLTLETRYRYLLKGMPPPPGRKMDIR